MLNKVIDMVLDKQADILYIINNRGITGYALPGGKVIKQIFFAGFLKTLRTTFLSIDGEGTLYFDDQMDKLIYSYHPFRSKGIGLEGGVDLRVSYRSGPWYPIKGVFAKDNFYILENDLRAIRVFKK